MEFVDTHCHIHEVLGVSDIAVKWHDADVHDVEHLIADAASADVTRLICVGCSLADSRLAVDFVQKCPECWASIGIHPHEAKEHLDDEIQQTFAKLAGKPKVVAVGECGLDYFYNHSARIDQERVLRFQIELALKHNLPMIFHVRNAFDEFWPIFDSYRGVRGVIHSFSATEKELEQILQRNLYVGLNGIMTFTKDTHQLAAAKAVPLDRLILETDAPYLTPAPYRGKICEPKHVRVTAEFLANLRDEPLERLALSTTQNASNLFKV